MTINRDGCPWFISKTDMLEAAGAQVINLYEVDKILVVTLVYKPMLCYILYLLAWLNATS